MVKMNIFIEEYLSLLVFNQLCLKSACQIEEEASGLRIQVSVVLLS